MEISKITHKYVLNEWGKDCKIDNTILPEESLKGASLHHKYITMLAKVKCHVSLCEKEFKLKKAAKRNYIKGEATEEEIKKYNLDQMNLSDKMLKSDSSIDKYLKGDKELIEEECTLEYLKQLSESLTLIVKEIQERNWTIKNHIEILKFQAGF